MPAAGRSPGAAVRCRTLPADAGTAWRHGLHLGLHCSYSCAGLTAILLVTGVMNLQAMAVVAAAITLERLAPAELSKRFHAERGRWSLRRILDDAVDELVAINAIGQPTCWLTSKPR